MLLAAGICASELPAAEAWTAPRRALPARPPPATAAADLDPRSAPAGPDRLRLPAGFWGEERSPRRTSGPRWLREGLRTRLDAGGDSLSAWPPSSSQVSAALLLLIFPIQCLDGGRVWVVGSERNQESWVRV